MPSRSPRAGPTINDVARRAGVSRMTVSRMLKGEGNVSAETREMVRAAMNDLAEATQSGARLRLGLIYSNPSATYLAEFLFGGLDQASRRDAQIVIEKCERGDHELEVARHLIDSGVAGIMLSSPLCDSPALLRMLASERIPMVLVGSAKPFAEAFAVNIDDAAAAAAMTEHLIALGHRRIGFIVGNPDQTVSAKRRAGFERALTAAGLAGDPALIAQGRFTYRSGLEASERLLDLADPPSAIFASNDDMAAAAVAVAHRRGIDVPADLTVCGFDDTALATAIWPELTTVHQPIADMARTAVDLLVTHGRTLPEQPGERQRLLDYRVVRRQSDAAPRRRPQTRR